VLFAIQLVLLTFDSPAVSCISHFHKVLQRRIPFACLYGRLMSVAGRNAYSKSGSESCPYSDVSFGDPPHPVAFSREDAHIYSKHNAILVG